MSENQNKGDQQPNVEKVKYVVGNDLDYIEDEYYYKLYREDCSEDSFLISLDDITLSPGMILEFNIDKEDFSFFDEFIVKFNFDDLIMNYYSSLKDYNFISFYVSKDLFDLNKTYSGIIVSEKDKDVASNNFHKILFNTKSVYEVKLDKEIEVKSIKRKFKKIYLLSDALLIGNKVENFKINPESLFNNNNDVSYSKPVLYTEYYDKNIVLSKEDSSLFIKDRFYTQFNEYAKNIFLWVIIITLSVNAGLIKSVFAFDWSMIIPVFLLIAWFYFLQTDKVSRNKNYNISYKDNLIYKIKGQNILGTIAGGVVIFFLLFVYTKNYKYKSEYIYDTQKQVFLEDNSFVVPNGLFLKTNDIVDRFKPVYAKHSIDLVYQTPGSLLSFSNKYIDLEVNFEFNKGDFLLGTNLKKVLSDIRNVMQKNISKGLYGDLSSMNTYNYRVTMVDIERDIMQLLTAYLDSNKIKSEDIVKNVSITTKYAKLHNVD